MKRNEIKELAEIICRDCLCGEVINHGAYLEWRGARVNAVIETLKEWGLEGLLEMRGSGPTGTGLVGGSDEGSQRRDA